MSDDFEPFATAGSGKSDPEVAFDLLNKLKGQGVWGEKNKPAILDMYAECLDAVKGLRAYEGQNRIETPVRRVASAQPQTAPSVAAPAVATPAPAIATPAQQMAQPAPQSAPQPNPVQSQQQHLQQQINRQA